VLAYLRDCWRSTGDMTMLALRGAFDDSGFDPTRPPDYPPIPWPRGFSRPATGLSRLSSLSGPSSRLMVPCLCGFFLPAMGFSHLSPLSGPSPLRRIHCARGFFLPAMGFSHFSYLPGPLSLLMSFLLFWVSHFCLSAI